MAVSKFWKRIFDTDDFDTIKQFNRGAPLVSVTAATLTLTAEQHAGKTMVLNRAAGSTVTLPAPTGTGNIYRFVVGTTVTSNDYGIDAAAATQLFKGTATVYQDGGSTALHFEAGAADHEFNMNGTTTGGIIGDLIEFQDISATHWQVNAVISATGAEATPFAT